MMSRHNERLRTIFTFNPRVSMFGRLARQKLLLGAWVACASLLLLAWTSGAQAQDNTCDHLEYPDLIVGDVGAAGRYADTHRWGTVGGISAYNFAATACNIGTCWAEWRGSTAQHPVIGQNLFRLKDGRFEQLGQSWLKHGFATENGTLCGECLASDDQHLGIYCSDLYVGPQFFSSGLAPKSDVNPYTGTFVVPSSGSGQTGNSIFRRLQVQNTDLDPAQNPGAKYFAEVQYISHDEAMAGKGANNASYRRTVVSGSNGVYFLTLTESTVAGAPAIMAWRSLDPSVVLTEASLPGDGKIYVAVKVTYLGGGTWRYEYAVQNLNSNKAPLAFSVPYPQGAAIGPRGFHDVNYHSGFAQSGTDWGGLVGQTSVMWKAPLWGTGEEGTPNIIRWGTLYNFRFDVNAAPGTHNVLLGFTPSQAPFTESLAVPILTPSTCDTDGVCDPGESCASCAADCAQQGGGSGCCGNGACEPGESQGACFADCAVPTETESACGDGRDDDGDGEVDCLDTDCCADIACDGLDVDGDSRAAPCDCNDATGTAWATPGETGLLVLVPNQTQGVMLYWQPPADPGGVIQYDAIRSGTPSDFVTSAICLPDVLGTSVADPAVPDPSSAYFYLVRAKNACPSGLGSLGESSLGVPRAGRSCP